MINNKKASIGLRIVIAAIILCLIIIGTFFLYDSQLKKKGTRSPGIPDYIPTSTNPLPIPNKIELKKDKTEIEIGYYNKGNNKTINSKLGITECISAGYDENGNLNEDPLPKDIPIVNSPCKEVMPSESSTFEIVIEKPETLGPGNYICRMIVFNAGENCDLDPRDYTQLLYPRNESYKPEITGAVYYREAFRLDINKPNNSFI